MKSKSAMDWASVRRMALINYSIATAVSIAGMSGPVPWWISGLTFGTLITLGVCSMQIVIPRLRLKSFAGTVLLQFVAMVLLMGGSFAAAIMSSISFIEKTHPFESKFWIIARNLVDYPQVRYPFGIFLLLTFLISMIMQFSRKLGPGVLWNWISGKYHEPKEETRIFMFLDLRDSTTLAEKLGALKFSALVRDFFNDVSEPCAQHHAEISHYIGDEAVISWRVDRGLKNSNCVSYFFAVKQAISRRADYYQSKYGLIPDFKAGIHIGPVVATEVGDSKSEIVFHGDVMNTTARIQGLCNEEIEALLISGDLAKELTRLDQTFQLRNLGDRALKGRVAPIQVLAIEAAEIGKTP